MYNSGYRRIYNYVYVLMYIYVHGPIDQYFTVSSDLQSYKIVCVALHLQV